MEDETNNYWDTLHAVNTELQKWASRIGPGDTLTVKLASDEEWMADKLQWPHASFSLGYEVIFARYASDIHGEDGEEGTHRFLVIVNDELVDWDGEGYDNSYFG